MPPSKRNPAAGKQSAEARVRPTVRKDGTRVRAYTRSVNLTRIGRTWAGTATSGVVCVGIIAEAGFTLASTLGVTLIALLTGAAVLAGNYAEKNKKTMTAQSKKRRATKRKPTARRTTTRRTGTPRKRR